MSRRTPALSTITRDALPPGSKLLVAVSGGKDSISLLHLIHSLARELTLTIEVAHVNHNLRPDSGMDRDLVTSTAGRMGVRCHVKELSDPRSDSAPPGVSHSRTWSGNLEAWGREERYAFFTGLQRSLNFDWIVTAHTANDAAETLLMRLIANKETGTILARDERRQVLRPLLRASREQIDEYAHEHQLDWREDSSNLDLSFTRNRIRHRVLPFLEQEFGKGTTRSVAERAAGLGGDDELLDELAHKVATQIGPVTFNSEGWLTRASEVLATTPLSLQWRAVGILFLPILGFPLGPRRSLPVIELIVDRKGRLDIDANTQLSATSRGVLLSKEGVSAAGCP